MAKVNGNLFMDRLSGSLGDQLIVKKAGAAARSSAINPPFARIENSARHNWLGSRLSGRRPLRDSHKLNPVYIEKAQGTAKCSYNVAIGDWLHPPEILEVDLSNWNGEAG